MQNRRGTRIVAEGIEMKPKQKTFVYTSIRKEGIHCFPEAATNPQFATGDGFDVSHLAFPHMHYFFIKVWVEVQHSNRDIEFIQLGRLLEQLYGQQILDLNSRSCEMIAEELFDQLHARWPKSEIRIDVSEDNINGALVEFVPNSVL